MMEAGERQSKAKSASTNASSAVKTLSEFYVMATGQIESCQLADGDNLYCKYSFNHGPDWILMHGLEHGISQIAQKSHDSRAPNVVTWNYPLDVTLRTTNVHGWPQVVLSVYGINSTGNDVVKGYGWTHVPTTPGRHVRYVRLYLPRSSSLWQRFESWIKGEPPEFFDPKFIAQHKDRAVSRVRSSGAVKIIFNVSTKNMVEIGYRVDHLSALKSEGPAIVAAAVADQKINSTSTVSGSGSASASASAPGTPPRKVKGTTSLLSSSLGPQKSTLSNSLDHDDDGDDNTDGDVANNNRHRHHADTTDSGSASANQPSLRSITAAASRGSMNAGSGSGLGLGLGLGSGSGSGSGLTAGRMSKVQLSSLHSRDTSSTSSITPVRGSGDGSKNPPSSSSSSSSLDLDHGLSDS